MAKDLQEKATDTPGRLGPDEKIEFLFKVINRLDFYINSTNTKASLIIAWNSLVIGTILVKYDDILSSFSCPTCGAQMLAFILFLIGAAGVVSIFFVLTVIYPYLKETGKTDISYGSLLYFEAISAMKTEGYYKRMGSVTNKELVDDLSSQVVALSDGLLDKMKKVKEAIWIVFFQLVLMGALVAFKVSAHVDFSVIWHCIGGGK